MGTARTAAVIWLAGGSTYLVCEAISAACIPGYSYSRDLISDLGVTQVMNIGAFMAHGALLAVGAIVMTRAGRSGGWVGRSFVLAAITNAVGNVLVGTFHSGMAPTPAHLHWHAIGAGLAILGGNIAACIAGFGGGRAGASPGYRRASVACGLFGIACLVLFVLDGQGGSRVLPAGIVERGAVYPIIGWEIMTGLAILFSHARQHRRGKLLT